MSAVFLMNQIQTDQLVNQKYLLLAVVSALCGCSAVNYLADSDFYGGVVGGYFQG